MQENASDNHNTMQSGKIIQLEIAFEETLLAFITFNHIYKAPYACLFFFFYPGYCCFLSIFPTSWVKDRSGPQNSQHVASLSKKRTSQTLAPSVQRLSHSHHRNRLTIIAHIADYISDGCLGGKHLNGSPNNRVL